MIRSVEEVKNAQGGLGIVLHEQEVIADNGALGSKSNSHNAQEYNKVNMVEEYENNEGYGSPQRRVDFEGSVAKSKISEPGAGSLQTSSASNSISQDATVSANGESGELKSDSDAGNMFKKKDVVRNRTQSVQSVLSTASLKSLANGAVTPTITSSNSDIKRNNSMMRRSVSHNFKNFQSFIQAPVLSSISNLKSSEDNIEIGQQLPFHNSQNIIEKRKDSIACSPNTKYPVDEDSNADKDMIKQQQKLTLNALKKLSLSPIPIFSETKEASVTQSPNDTADKALSKTKVGDNYQPAQVDLSTFASLKRQPKVLRREVVLDTKNPNIEHDIPLPNSDSNAATVARSSPVSKQSSKNENTKAETKELTNSSDMKENTPGREFEDEANSTSKQRTQEYHNQIRRNMLQSVEQTKLQNQKNNLPRTIEASIPRKSSPSSSYNANSRWGNSGNSHQNMTKVQQIKGLRNPLYVPAVLRMTNHKISSSPSHLSASHNREVSLRSRSDVSNGDTSSSVHIPENSRNNSSTGSLGSIETMKTADSIESNRSTSLVPSKNGVLLDKRKYDEYLNQAPTKRHWLKDESVLKCQIPSCSKVFNFFERRHHCRRCGGIFCKEHTSHYLYINHLAQFTTGGRGTLSKVCNNCIHEYNDFIKHEFGVDISSPPLSTNSNDSGNSVLVGQQNRTLRQQLPVGMTATNIDSAYKPSMDAPQDSSNINEPIVGSVPVNWSWSSF